MRRRSARRVFWAAVLCVSVLMAPGKCCLSKEYELRDGQCCPMCHEGSVVRRDCTPQSDPWCVPCVNGTFMNKPNGRTKCFSCSSCDQGRGLFVQQGCTSKSDTICDVITGYFCEALVDDKGCSSARRHSGCGAGHRIKERGTRRTDTVCEPCPPGSFSLEGLNCTLWTTCSETKLQVEEGSPTSDAICAAASRHHYIILVVILLMILLIGILVVLWFKGAAVLCVSVLMAPGKCCLSKEYELRDGQCCPMCHEGSVVKRDCTPQSGTRCVPCVNGTFMNQPNGLTKCFPCSSCDQGRGLFVQQGCTSKSDTICDVITGYFCEALVDDKGCSSARRHSGCGAGHRIKERGTRRTDTVCEPCPPGSFSLEGLNCTLWTTCSETKLQVEEGSPTSDAICAAASRHHYIILVVILLMILLIGILVVLWFKG